MGEERTGVAQVARIGPSWTGWTPQCAAGQLILICARAEICSSDGDNNGTRNLQWFGTREEEAMLATEQGMTFSESARWLGERHGRKITPSTVWRWARVGVRGQKLESRLLGGMFLTSIEALDRFSKALAEAAPEPRRHSRTESSPRGRTARQREHAIAQAERRLDHAGIR